MDSAICTEKQMLSPDFQQWAGFYGLPPGLLQTKSWEWCFISQALKEYEMLGPGKRGLGFAVGEEPLPSSFASFGASITATDLDFEEAAKRGWGDVTCKDKTNLNAKGLCPPSVFDNLVNLNRAI